MEVHDATEEGDAMVEKNPRFPGDGIVIPASEYNTIVEKHVSRESEERYGMHCSLRKTTK